MTKTENNMKTSLKLAVLGLLLANLSAELSTAFAQGSLTPPGAPAATMRTLDQIYGRTDARIPITNSTSAVTISQPGSYYLTTNLTVSGGDAITIATNGVSLDLNGYTIRSTAASAAGAAVLLGSRLRNITIANGFIESGVITNGVASIGSGFGYGIHYSNSVPANVVVSRVSIVGCLYDGISLGTGYSTVVEGCTLQLIGRDGILASTVKTSSATDCGHVGIGGFQVSDCRGQSSGDGSGVSAINAQNCYGASNDSYGVYATTALNCSGFSSGSYGVYASASAVGCNGTSTSGVGLYARNANTCVGYRIGGTAIQAIVANGCYAVYGTNNITHKYNMP